MSAAVEVVDQVGMGPVEGPVTDLAKAVLHAESHVAAVVVAFVAEQAMVELNHRYLGLEGPTDVLAFPETDPGVWAEPPDGESGSTAGSPAPLSGLGEVVVCPAVVYRYAVEDGADPRARMGWTLIHGLLHLLGYDHEVDVGEMRLREQGLLRDLEYLIEALPISRRTEDGA